MALSQQQQQLLRQLPGIDLLLEQAKQDPSFSHTPKILLADTVRALVEDLRQAILAPDQTVSPGSVAPAKILAGVRARVKMAMRSNLRRVINASGVVVHTNLGRSLLAAEACENLAEVARNYTNLEYDLARGRRGSRYASVEELICEISGADAAMVVNNNAAAVLLCLETMARDREVIVSRGELVEIGGSFRVPDIMAKSGARLKEVGTTNRTHLRDYEAAIGGDTGLLLKVHTSNYSIVGFTTAVGLPEMVDLGTRHGLPVMEDLGSGTFVDFSRYGLTKEPTIQESVAAGIDLVTFSGDKLLGGPQAGVIVGKKEHVDRIKQNPLTRALRIDKLTLAALESTLRLYRDEQTAVARIPTLHLLTVARSRIEQKALRLEELLLSRSESHLTVNRVNRPSKAGGGSLPLLEIPSQCVAVAIRGISPNRIEQKLRTGTPPIIGRIEDDRFIMDLRCVKESEIEEVAAAIHNLLAIAPTPQP